MNEFLWGMIVGGAVSPFAWEGLKWCYRKMIEVTSK
jgi:hypothetical protein